jgi:single-strand DNA-binding protein
MPPAIRAPAPRSVKAVALSFSFRLFVPRFLAKETNKPSPEKEQHMKKNEKTEQKTSAAPAYTNRVTLVGFIADKADYYVTGSSGFSVLRLATKASWIDKTSGKWESHTDWHRIVAWNGLADAVKDYAKGDHVMVEGELRSSEYDREVQVIGAGKAVVSTKTWEIRARAIRKLDRKPKAESQPKADVPAKTKKKAA